MVAQTSPRSRPSTSAMHRAVSGTRYAGIGSAAVRRRRQERGVGLDQELVERATAAAPRAGGSAFLKVSVPGEGQVPAPVGAEPGHRGVAGEAVEDGVLRRALVVEHAQDVVVRVPVVDHQRLAVPLRQVDVPAEGRLLGGPAASSASGTGSGRGRSRRRPGPADGRPGVRSRRRPASAHSDARSATMRLASLGWRATPPTSAPGASRCRAARPSTARPRGRSRSAPSASTPTAAGCRQSRRRPRARPVAAPGEVEVGVAVDAGAGSGSGGGGGSARAGRDALVVTGLALARPAPAPPRRRVVELAEDGVGGAAACPARPAARTPTRHRRPCRSRPVRTG